MACDLCAISSGLVKRMWDGDALNLSLCESHAIQWDNGHVTFSYLDGEGTLTIPKKEENNGI